MCETGAECQGSLWRAPKGTVKRLREAKGLTMKELAKRSVTENTVRRLWGRGVSRGSLEKVSKALGVEPDDLAVAVRHSIDPESFYPAVGLHAAPPVNLPDNGCYQDWSEDGNDQAIEYLWAEAEGSWIKAEVFPKKDECDEEEVRFLRVSFSNALGTYPSNVGIHPKGMHAVAAADKRYLVFRARLADIDLDGVKTKHKKSGIGIAVRVRDAKLRHWEYKLAFDDYILNNVKEKPPECEWQVFSVDLTPDSGKWQRLSMDPPFEGEMPDFSVITSIVFELGPRPRKRRPDAGQGTVDFGQIFLMAEPHTDDGKGTER